MAAPLRGPRYGAMQGREELSAWSWLHVGRGRPWLGLLVSVVIVVAVPMLLWPSMLIGTFADLRDGF